MPAGRPREFDPETALDRALDVFWRKGFEGSSLSDLTAAMGISRPSLYAAFGDKAALFRRSMERYVQVHAKHLETALAEPTARQVVQTLWNGGISQVGNPRTPRGCFLVQGALACSDTARALQRAMAKERGKGEEALRERFARAVAEGDLPRTVDVAGLARYVTTVSYGMAVHAAGGASATDLAAVAAIALSAIP